MAKQTSKKMPAKKTAAKPAPVMKHECSCGADCRCHKHGPMHIVKHIIVWAIIFALGVACGKMTNCGHHKKVQRKIHPVFTNGCLDMTSIKCPKIAENIVKADVSGDNCISVEEYKAWKKENRQNLNCDEKEIKAAGQEMRHGLRGLRRSK